MLLPIVALLALVAPSAVRAFIPTSALSVGGVLGKSHVKMTKEAIEEIDLEFFGASDLTRAMKKARDEIADADAAVDENQMDASLHVDGESFPEAQARLIALTEAVVMALGNDDAAGARKALGGALHTLQDFYSHSNWIELGNGSPHPGLGQAGQSVNRLPASTPTCVDCTGGLPPLLCADCTANLSTTGLTSGYYGGESPPFGTKPAGKCSHGGIFDDSATGFFGQGINKDSTDCTFSPHNHLHLVAASVAKDATKLFIRNIRDQVTEAQIKLLLGVGPTLAIAIDTTGSMGSVIAGVKQQAIQIVNSRLGTAEEPLKYILVPFNDPGVGPVTVTTDPDTFKNAINALFASGGGDCPELAQSGMLQALSASDEGGDMFMFTDASAKDAGLGSTVSSLATSKDIRVYPILFGSCSPIDPSYISLASESGGQLFFLARSEAARITELAELLVRSNAVNVMLVTDSLGAAARNYAVPVDSSMRRVTFSISGSASVVVTRPDGSAVAAGDSDLKVLSLSGGTVISIATPQPGEWGLSLTGSGTFSLKVTGESALDLSSFRFVREGGRPGHEGFFPIDGFPLSGEQAIAVAEMAGPFASASFDLRNEAGGVLQALSLAPGPETPEEFSGLMSPPPLGFLVHVTGLDVNGMRYQRVLSGRVLPQTIKVSAPPATAPRPGSLTSYEFEIENLGPAGSFRITVSDDRGYLIGFSPSAVTLASGATARVTVQIQPPANAIPGTSDTLTVSVEGAGGARNFAVLTNIVAQPNQSPNCSQAGATASSLWPPDHKLVEVAVAGVTDPDGDPVTIEVDHVTQNEPTSGQGSGDKSPDAAGLGDASVQLRAERGGSNAGRLYTLSFVARDGRGGSCTGSVAVCVPHDSSATTCESSAGNFDSTQ